ncbi:MAG: hypothetical protein NTW87_08840 [Planctomycetota bacterium]|nr:hypothetical protein [Planctomycetota bacterium]
MQIVVGNHPPVQGMPSPSAVAALARLRLACAPVPGMGKKRCRKASVALYEFLAPQGGSQSIIEAAKAIFGVPPESWLTANEARRELSKLDVHRGLRFFYRVFRRARGTERSLLLDAQGRWQPVDSTQHIEGVAILTVGAGKPVRFRVSEVAWKPRAFASGLAARGHAGPT